MKNAIRPGDRVILAPTNGLGRGIFEVLKVDPKSELCGLYVRGENGHTWWARSEGAKVLVRAEEVISNPHW